VSHSLFIFIYEKIVFEVKEYPRAAIFVRSCCNYENLYVTNGENEEARCELQCEHFSKQRNNPFDSSA
jgi:hypothetical protein